jgi:DNA-directed RNA polymerase specialized sigma24 family protein
VATSPAAPPPDREVFIAALNRLPEPDRTILRLTFQTSLDFGRVAENLDLSRASVSTIARRALIALKDRLAERSAPAHPDGRSGRARHRFEREEGCSDD